MAQIQLLNLQANGVIRNSINSMFSELYNSGTGAYVTRVSGLAADGVTDDTAAILAACNALLVASPMGGTIVFPAATIICNALVLTQVHSGITFQGATSPHPTSPYRGTTFHCSSGYRILQILGAATNNRAYNIKMKNLAFYGNGTADMVASQYSSYIRFEECYFNSGGGHQLYFNEVWDSRLIDCSFTYCAGPTTVELYSLNSSSSNTNQIVLENCRWENNVGVDLALTGTGTNEIFLVGMNKFESGTVSTPRITAVNTTNFFINAQIACGSNTPTPFSLTGCKNIYGAVCFEYITSGAPVNYATIKTTYMVDLLIQIYYGVAAPSSGYFVDTDSIGANTNLRVQTLSTVTPSISPSLGLLRSEYFIGSYPTTSLPTTANVAIGSTARDTTTNTVKTWNGTTWA